MIRAARASALTRPALALGCALAGALTLSGCISVFPKSEPAQLYRFQYATTAPVQPLAGQRVGVYLATPGFAQEAASDQLLTLTGSRAAYIAESRWVAPAIVLWDQAVRDAFDAQAARVRLVTRGEPIHTDYALRLSVANFETDYEGGRPTVLVRVRATLTRARTREVVQEQVFEARAPAEDNRVGAIVAAYDKAVDQVLNGIVRWTDGTAVET